MEYQHEKVEKKKRAKKIKLTWPLVNKEDFMMEGFVDYLESRNLNPHLALKNGWYPSNMAGDDFPRIVIPATSTEGLTFWQARLMGRSVRPEVKRYQSPIVERGDAVVIVYPEQERNAAIVIVEGPMDALAVAGEGFTGVALMGKQPSSVVFNHIARRFKGRKAIICPDSDGVGAATRWVVTLQELGVSISWDLPYGNKKDFAEMNQLERAEWLQSV